MKYLVFIVIDLLIIFKGNAQKKGCVEEAENKYKIVYSLIDKANDYADKGDYKNEKRFSLKSVNLTKRLQKKYNCFSPSAYWKLADAYLHQGAYTEALETALKAYKLSESFFKEEDDCWNLSYSRMKIGNVYLAMGNDSLAINEYKKGIEVCKKNNSILKYFMLLNMADIDIQNSKFEDAKGKIDEVTDIVDAIISANNGVNDIVQVLLGRIHYLKGLIFFNFGNCEDALSNFLSSLHFTESVFDNRIISKTYYHIARIYHNDSKYEDAILYYKKCIDISKRMKYIDLIINASIYLSEIHFYQGQYKHSFFLLENAFKLSKETNFSKGIVDYYNFKAFYSGQLNKTEDLFVLSKSALSLSIETKYMRGLADAYDNLETYYELKQDYKLAKYYAYNSLLISDSINYILVKVDALNDLGDFYFNTSKNDSALIFYKEALNISKMGNYLTCGKYTVGEIDAYIKIGNVYRRKHKKDLAYENYYHALELSKQIRYFEGIIISINNIRMTKGKPPLKVKLNDKTRNKIIKKIERGQLNF